MGVIAVTVGLVLGLVPGVAAADHVTHDQFEIDGNLPVDTAGNHDWTGVGALGVEYHDGTEKAVAGFPDSGLGDGTWFKASTVEGDYPNWTFVDKGNADKSDLHRLFAASQVHGHDSYLWLGVSRISDNGNTQVTVEFNQNELTSPAQFGTAYREVGDVWIRFNFPGKASSETVTVQVDQWTAANQASGGAYDSPVTLPAGDFMYALGGLQTGAQTDFIEIQLSLEAIFGEGGLGLECADFGTLSFRTESSGGSDDNNQPTLKDIAGPFPIDLDTCADVQVEKEDADGNPLDGATFSVFSGSGAPATGEPVATCVTGPDPTDLDGTESAGACSFGALLPGTYTLHETGVPPGYRASPDLPVTFAVEQNTPLALGPFSDPRIPYTIDVTPAGRNAVGTTHTFTVSLDDDLGPVAGADLDLAWSGVGSISAISPTGPDATSCTTDGSGECTVTVQSDDAGAGTLTATFATPYQHTTGAAPGATTVTEGDPPTAAWSSISDSADKTWVGYVAAIEADGTNVLGDEHPFTARVWEVDGEGDPDGVLAEGVTVTVEWNGPPGSTIDRTTCVTDGDGECGFLVDSDADSGVGLITIIQLDGTIAGILGQPDESLRDTTPTAAPGGSLSAAKQWIAYRASIEASATNLVGEEHVFAVTAEQNSGSGWGLVPDTTVIGFTTSDDTKLEGDTCDSTVAGTCTITVDSETVDDVTVTITSVSADAVDDTAEVQVATVANGGLTATTPGSLSASKLWILPRTTPPDVETNIAGEEHIFTIAAELDVPFQDAPLVAPDGTEIGFRLVAGSVGSVVGQTADGDGLSTCVVAGGVCEITVVSTEAGTLELELVDITFTVTQADYPGLFPDADPQGDAEATFTVGFDTLVDLELIEPSSLQLEKHWREYRAAIGPDGLNLTGDPHTFTVVVEQSDDGASWTPAIGVDVTVANAAGVGDVVGGGTCTTVPDDATTDGVDEAGTCTVQVTSALPGLGTFEVATITVAHPETGAEATLGDGGVTDIAFDNSDTAAKTWAAFRSSIDGDAVNLTGDPHEFTVLTEYTVDNETWVPVPDGSVVAYSDDEAVGAPAVDTCDSTGTALGDAPGECTITVVSDVSGTRTITILAVKATITANGLTETFSVTYGDQQSGVLDYAATAGDYLATKTWGEYALSLTPGEARNVLPVDPDHAFTVTLTSDDEVVAPVGEQPVKLTLTGDVGAITAVEAGTVATDGLSATCETDALGQCVVTVTSTVPGVAQLAATYEAVVGASEPFTVTTSPATKVWVQPVIELVKTAVVGDGFADGDLLDDPETAPFLFFTSSDIGPKTAVYEYTITNPSNVVLEDVVLVDDRLGTIIGLEDGVTLAPDDGEPGGDDTYVIRASEQFDYFDATASLGALLTNVGTVTAVGEGVEVTDSDDATISLAAVQSSILLDVQKEVVDAGDVAFVDGLPIVSWTEEEYDDGVAKAVTYRLTVTNISNAAIIDVELLDPMLSAKPIIAVSDGVTLAPDESITVEVKHLLTVDEAFPNGPVAERVDNVATASGANETRDSFSTDSDDASVYTEIVFAEVLPETGLRAAGLAPLSLLLVTVGLAILWLERRRTRAG